MSTLREQLLRILPVVLPKSPAEAVTGTELLTRVREYLDRDYADSSIRQFFSIIAAEPDSPMARVNQGSGYYLRSEEDDSMSEETSMPEKEETGATESREQGQGGIRYKSISRIDQPKKRTHGWYVRVSYAGQQRVKFFSDRMYSGKDEALAEAVEFRNEAERELKKPRTDRPVVSRSRRSKTGVIGVRRITKRSRTKDGTLSERPAYEVTWSPAPRVVRRTSISIAKYGEREALRRAQALRQSKMREMYPTRPKSSSVKRRSRKTTS